MCIPVIQVLYWIDVSPWRSGQGGLGCVQWGQCWELLGGCLQPQAEGKAQLSCHEWSYSPKLQLLPHYTSPCISSSGTQFNQPQGLWEAGMPMGVRNVLLIARGLPHLQKGPMSRAASARAVHAHAVQNQQPEVSVSIPELDAE